MDLSIALKSIRSLSRQVRNNSSLVLLIAALSHINVNSLRARRLDSIFSAAAIRSNRRFFDATALAIETTY